MTNRLFISIAKDFSEYPAGRDNNDGDFNGETFRKSFLVPQLKKAIQGRQKLVVSLNGLKSAGSSFLESAFGGLVREEGFSKRDITDWMQLEWSRPELERYARSIHSHIDRARAEHT